MHTFSSAAAAIGTAVRMNRRERERGQFTSTKIKSAQIDSTLTGSDVLLSIRGCHLGIEWSGVLQFVCIRSNLAIITDY